MSTTGAQLVSNSSAPDGSTALVHLLNQQGGDTITVVDLVVGVVDDNPPLGGIVSDGGLVGVLADNDAVVGLISDPDVIQGVFSDEQIQGGLA